MDAYIGEIRMFAGQTAPSGWLLCDGRVLPVRGNTALYSAFGNQFGGTVNVDFALPDLRDSVVPGAGPVQGAIGYRVGQVGGSNSVTIDPRVQGVHSHALYASTAPGTSAVPGPDVGFASLPAQDRFYNVPTPDDPGTLAPLSGLALAASGQGEPIDNRMPSLAINFIICVAGIYPGAQ